MAKNLPPAGPTPNGPNPDLYAGSGFGPGLKRAFFATRPKFFTASILPVVVGTALGARAAGAVQWQLALLALLATVLVHAAANVLNDVGDDLSGADAANTGRIYPYTGGSRFIQTGILSRTEMTRLGAGLLLAAALAGTLLLLERGLDVLWLGLVGIALGTLYSLPRIYLAARGLGELAVAIAFGVLPVCGAAWLQDGGFDLGRVLVGIPVGIWVALILLINEVPDVEGDAAAGKRTLVVRFGLAGTRGIYLALHMLALAASIGAIVLGALALWYAIAAVALAASGTMIALTIADVSTHRALLQKSIEMTLAIQAVGSLMVVAAITFR